MRFDGGVLVVPERAAGGCQAVALDDMWSAKVTKQSASRTAWLFVGSFFGVLTLGFLIAEGMSFSQQVGKGIIIL